MISLHNQGVNRLKSFLKIALPAFVVAALLFWALARTIEPLPEKKLTIAVGRKTGIYYQCVQKYRQFLKDLDITILTTAGSVEILNLLNQGKADIGFLQGGIGDEESTKELRSIASIYFEPIWIFYNKNLGDIVYINGLKGKRISVGERQSGTEAVAVKLLNKNGLTQENTRLLNLDLEQSFKALSKGEIDAFFTVISPEAPQIRDILSNKQISLLNLKRTKAYESFFPYITDIVLHEGSIDLMENIPGRDIKLLSTVATVVVRQDVDPALVRFFAKAVKNAGREKVLFKEGIQFPTLDYLWIPVHEEAKRYFEQGDTFLEKIFPYWIALKINRLKILLLPVLTLLIPLLKGILPVWKWRIRKKIYRWYKTLEDIDRRCPGFTRKQAQDALRALKDLEIEVNRQTDVPLSYMGEFYMLKTHIQFIMDKLNKLLETGRADKEGNAG